MDESAAPSTPTRKFALADLVPLRAERRPLRDLLPANGLQAALLAGLLALMLGYCLQWAWGHRWILADLNRQNDDACQHLFHYHAYGSEGALADDPVAQAARVLSPPAVRGLYALLVPAFGLFVASKLVQALCWSIMLAAAWILLRAARGGWAAACVLLFLLLHTPEITNRIVGGLPRAFGYPLAALWLAGAISGSERTRWVAGVLSAAAYPFVTLLLLGAEGFLKLGEGVDLRRRDVRAGWLRYGVMIGLCFAALLPYQLENGERGELPTFEQASKDPVFHDGGREEQLPLPNPVAGPLDTAIEVLFVWNKDPVVNSEFPFLHSSRRRTLVLLAVVAAAVGFGLARRWPVPAAGLAMLAAAIVLYAAARQLAFRLYIPARYYEFGIPIAVIGLISGSFTLIGYRWTNEHRRRLAQWSVACIIIGGMLLTVGNGVWPNNGLLIDRSKHAGLYGFASSLPLGTRFATHPYDGNEIPYWSARATSAAQENILPWDYSNWPNQLRRGESALRAIYSTQPATLLAYCREWRCTHVLVNRKRYGDDLLGEALVFEPLDTMLRELLRDVDVESLVLADPPPEAVVYEDAEWRVLDVAKLEAVWSTGATP